MPRKKSGKPVMVVTSFKFSPEELARLRDGAHALGCSQGEVVREAVGEYLAKREAQVAAYRRLRRRSEKAGGGRR